MSQWTDRHYNYTYKLTGRDIIAGEIRVDAYFVAKVWKTGSKDDSGALWHCLKTIARFGDKNDVEREIKALYAQVKGLARSFDVELETEEDEGLSVSSNTGEEIAVQYVNENIAKEVDKSVDNTLPSELWYPDNSGEWVETSTYDFESVKEHLAGHYMEVLANFERDSKTRYKPTIQTFECWFGRCTDWGNRVAFKLVK